MTLATPLLLTFALACSQASQSGRASPQVPPLRTVPAGQPLLKIEEGETVQVTTKGGYEFGWVTQVLQPSGKSLGPVRYRIALPKGKSLTQVATVLLTIPPGGSAPILAPQTCAQLGIASVALQGTTGGRDDARLASLGIAVANDLLRVNPELKFIFAGFSMGGFAAQNAGQHMLDRCIGLLLVGNYYLAPPLPGNRPIVMLVGSQDMHLGYAEKSLKEQLDYGTNIQLLTMPGGHGYGRAEDQNRALKALLSRRPA